MRNEDLEFLENRLLKAEKTHQKLLQMKADLADCSIGYSLDESIHSLNLLIEEIHEEMYFCEIPKFWNGRDEHFI